MLADVRWLFQFVDGGDRVVLPRNAAALLVGQELVLAEPEFAGPLAGADHCRGRQEGPVEGRLPAQQVEELAALGGLRLVGRRELGRVDQLDARRHFEASGAADDEVAFDASNSQFGVQPFFTPFALPSPVHWAVARRSASLSFWHASWRELPLLSLRWS